jgi:ribosomal protein S26
MVRRFAGLPDGIVHVHRWQSESRSCLDSFTVPQMDLKQTYCVSHAYGNAFAKQRSLEPGAAACSLFKASSRAAY